MNNGKNCFSCGLGYCIHNKRYDEEFRKKLQKKCFIEIIGSSRPVYCHTCIISKMWLPIEKYEESMRLFQIAEGNIPCFKLKASCFYLWVSRYEPPREIQGLELKISTTDCAYGTLAISSIKLVSVLEECESHIIRAGDKLLERATRVARYGERAARFLLEFQDELPEEWKTKRINLLFPATKRKRTTEQGGVYIPSLIVNQDQWFLSFVNINGHFDEKDFFVSI